MSEIFRVYAINKDGSYYEPYVTESPENAVNKAVLFSRVYPEVLICDSLDYCNFHYKDGRVIYPENFGK